jgi:uncharacterized protein YndB with AHSA1/START domain
MDNVKVTKDVENKALIMEATFDAPKEKLWKAYTTKELFEQWWGPQGWQTTAKEFDFRPGGRVHYGMKCVDENQGEWFGQESWGITEINTVDEMNSYMATDHFADAEGNMNADMPTLTLSVEFKEAEGKTTVINKAIAESVEQLEQLVKMGMAEGFSSQLGRLEALMAK